MSDSHPDSRYDHRKIEKKWQEFWKTQKTFRAQNDSTKKKYYALDMFPYPSGAGLHVGHPLGYTATDIISRYKRMKGYEVLHPMGWDAFGLPAENYAIKTKVHPEESTLGNITTFTRQIQELGFSYDWDREIGTCLPEYYRWTQWFFAFLYQHDLAYKKKAPVNWCNSCHTVLANEQVVNGNCERCKNAVVQKELEQWFFKIREFIEDQGQTSGLLQGLEKIDWPESTKTAQKNWIGKSEGLIFTALVKESDIKIQTFSTHFEAFYADTFVVIAPDHPLLPELLAGVPEAAEVLRFCEDVLQKRIERGNQEEKEPEGIFTGRYIVDPIGNGDLPIWVASYALADYGTGIVKCSAHDERDFAFAKKYNIRLKPVLFPTDADSRKKVEDLEICYTDMQHGVLTEPTLFAGKVAGKNRQNLADFAEQQGFATRTTIYRLRDWLVSRQRYWGSPIPIVYDDQGHEYVLPDDEMPVHLPKDVDFMPTGESPLTHSKSFHDPKDLARIEQKLKDAQVMPPERKIVRREVDTMDTFVCSSWYMFRFMDPQNTAEFASTALMNKWGPVDLYVGGAEHTVLHLLYSRFFTKALHRHGYIDFDEPFSKLRHQGMILGEDGQKMSKSIGNVINPDEIVQAFGADTLRCYEMFMGPFHQKKPWSTGGVEGVRKFLDRVYRVFQKEITEKSIINYELPITNEITMENISPKNSKSKTINLHQLLHQTIKKVTEDIESFHFNTAISQMMILTNELTKLEQIPREVLETFALLISPFAPHLAEEVWAEILGHKGGIAYLQWPQHNENYLQEDTVTYAVQVNGKVRAEIAAAKDANKDEVLAKAKSLEKIQGYLDQGEVKKEIFVSGRIVGFVVK